MTRYSMKRKLAAALAIVMLSGCTPFAALAEGEATPGEAEQEQTLVFGDASASGHNASLDTASDGQITGSVDFSGDKKMVIKLYRNGSQVEQKGRESSGSFTFKNLSPGSYTLKFFFWGEGNQEPRKTIDVKVGYDSKSETGGSGEGGTGGTGGSGEGGTGGTGGSGEGGTGGIGGSGEGGTGGTGGSGEGGTGGTGGSGEGGTGGTGSTGGESGTPQTPVYGEMNAYSDKATAQTAADGSITASVTYSGEATVVVKLYSAAKPNEKITHKTIKTSGNSVTFDGLVPGEYRVDAHFFGNPTPEGSKTVTVGYQEEKPEPEEKKFTEVNCTATKASAEGAKDGRITGSVSYTGESTVVIKLYAASDLSTKLDQTTVKVSGGSFSFDGLAAGTYKVDFHFYGEPAAQSRTVEVGTEKPPVAKIQITGVAGGENKLTVKGTAQAGAQLLVSAKPDGAAKAEVLTASGDGAFSADLVAKPGTYTRVTAVYVTDASSAVSADGAWKVTEPAKPTLTVDPVNVNSTKVVAKTAAGVVVTLTTKDSTQTLTADADGIVRFPLAHTYLKGDVFTLTVVYGSGSGQSFSERVTVEGADQYDDLQYGDTGDAVLRLTTRLHELGYPVSVTDRFGSTVREAVRLFQISNGLNADGRAGVATQTVLYSVSAIAYGADRYPTLVRGDRGLSLIYTLQQRLKDLGYYTIRVDGIFGSGTERAVRLFQRVNGMSETGKADNATQTLLYSSAAKPIGSGWSGDYTTLSRSNRYRSAVVPLQRRLKSLGYYTGSIDGYFGSATYRAVRNFQSRNGLSVTGVADPYTQEVLYSSDARKASGSSSGSSSSTGYRLLYWGCRGDSVKRLQNALINAGYKSIVRKADGIYGQWTYDAVRAYQKDHGLAVDGIAGKNTQNSLYGTHY